MGEAPRVYVSENAFLQLLVSSVELYPTEGSDAQKDGEAFGYLFGYQATQNKRPVYRVDFVVPCQRVTRRTHSQVQPCSVAEK